MYKGKLLRQAIQTPDGTVLVSTHRHDYQTHLDEVSGEVYMVDGGTDYLRGSINKVPATPMHLFTTDPHGVLREEITWGTYGKSGDEPYQRKCVASLSNKHITAILDTQKMIDPALADVLRNELEYRGENQIVIEDGE